jgi:hypothetical protein
VVTSYGVLCSLAPILGAGSSSRTRNMPPRLYVSSDRHRPVQIGRVAADRLDQSSSAIPIFETGARLSDGIEHTIFGGTPAAFDPKAAARSVPRAGAVAPFPDITRQCAATG